MAHKAAAAIKLLELLRDAAEYQDFEAVVQAFKRMLQPWGLRLMEDPSRGADVFTSEDEYVLGGFWRRLLNLPANEPDILARAASFYMPVHSASTEREYVYVQQFARQLCASVVLVCNELLSAEKPAEERQTKTGFKLHVVR